MIEDLKEALAKHLENKSYAIIIDGKVYKAKELAEHIRKETEVGKKFIEMAVKGTIERYGKRT